MSAARQKLATFIPEDGRQIQADIAAAIRTRRVAALADDIEDLLAEHQPISNGELGAACARLMASIMFTCPDERTREAIAASITLVACDEADRLRTPIVGHA